VDPKKQETLEWFVNYAQMDLDADKIRPGDKAKLTIEAGEYLFPQKKELDSLLPFAPASWAFEQSSPEEYWKKIVLSQAVIRLRLGAFLFQREAGYKGTGWSQKQEVVTEMTRGDKAFSFSYLPITKTLNEYLEFKVDRLFDGVPVSTLNRCPGCKKLFLNFTLREKKYCSRQCLWRVSAEKYREAHGEEYRAKMKKLMRKRYVPKKKGKAVASKAGKKGQK
jgi:hypothetical protein